MNSKTPLESLQHIESMMEKSTKFKSISSFTWVIVGVFALIASYFIEQLRVTATYTFAMGESILPVTVSIVKIIVSLLIICLLTAMIMSKQKATKNKESLLSTTSKRLAFALSFPMIIGGLFLLLCFGKVPYYMLWSGMLLFYGLGLINASKYTLTQIHTLGIFQTIFGLLGMLFPYYAFYIWAFGFGVFHIIFGLFHFFKYERN